MTHFVVALWCEAKPLIDRLGLRPAAAPAPFRHHRGAEASLVVCGVGKARAAAAAGYLFAAEGAVRDRPWINFGIAGHRDLEIGRGLLAHKVEDAASGRVWYPCPLFELPVRTAAVRSFDRVSDEYPADAACDMEAAGFCSAASCFSSAELMQVYKVVSDGPGTDRATIDAARVGELVAAHVDTVASIAGEIAALAGEIAAARPAVDLAPWLERWRFSVSRRRRLAKLLARLAVVSGRAPAADDLVVEAGDAAAVLRRLEESLAAASEGVG